MKLYNHHTASFTINNGSTQVRDKLTTITTKEITEFTATATNLTLLATLSAGNYGRLAHIDNLVIEEIFEVGEGYRFGFNGKENDGEVEGQQDYGMRIYDKRLARFKSVDPLTKEYAMLTPYQFSSNSPIDGIDLDGLEHYYAADGRLIGKIGTSTEIRKVKTENVRAVAYWINAANKPPKAADPGFTGRATTYANSLSYVEKPKEKAECSLIGKLYGDEYGEYSGDDNHGNDRVAPGGPDYAGVAANADASVVAGAGGQVSVLETPQGTGTYVTVKTILSGTSLEFSPSFEMGWKTEAVKDKTTSSVIPGNGQYVSFGLGIMITLSKGMDDRGKTTSYGLSIGLGAGVATGVQHTFEKIGKAKESTNE